MALKTKRWNDPVERDDGLRLLVCRFRPRAVKTEDETWDVWWKELAPSRELHADIYGKNDEAITWDEFRQRYAEEMKEQQDYIKEIADMVAEGKTITLLCSNSCTDESRCHRSLLRELVEESMAAKAV